MHRLRPNLFLTGFEKCGTTSLANWLGQHPDICVSSPKEPKFFVRDYHKGIHWYMMRYYDYYKGQKYIMDACHMNSTVEYCADRILESSKTAPQFIFTVRDPVKRAFSAWNHFRSMRPGREVESFGQAYEINKKKFPNYIKLEREYMNNIDPRGGLYWNRYIENGLYYYHINRFIKKFGKDSIMVVVLDDMREYPQAVMDDITDFLDLPRSNYCFSSFNEGKYETNVYEDYPFTAQALQNIYKNDLTNLSKLIKLDLIDLWW